MRGPLGTILSLLSFRVRTSPSVSLVSALVPLRLTDLPLDPDPVCGGGDGQEGGEPFPEELGTEIGPPCPEELGTEIGGPFPEELRTEIGEAPGDGERTGLTETGTCIKSVDDPGGRLTPGLLTGKGGGGPNMLRITNCC